MGTQGLQVGGENSVDAAESLDSHGGGQVSRRDEDVEVGEGHDQLAEHTVGPVDEGQPLLLTQRDRGQSGLGKTSGGVDLTTVGGQDSPFPGEDEGTVGQRGEVARTPKGPVFPDDRHQPRVEQVSVGSDDLRAHAGVARCHGLETQSHHGADDFGLHPWPGRGGVGTDEGVLQGHAMVTGHSGRG